MANPCLENVKGQLRVELNDALEKRVEQLGEADQFQARVLLKDLTEEYLATKRRQKYKELRQLNVINDIVRRMDEVDSNTLADLGQSPLLAYYKSSHKTLFGPQVRGGNAASRAVRTVDELSELRIQEFLSQLPSLSKVQQKTLRAKAGLNITKEEQAGVFDAMMNIGNPTKEAKQMADEFGRLFEHIRVLANHVGLDIPKSNSKWAGPMKYKPLTMEQLHTKESWGDELIGAIPEGEPGAGVQIINRELTVNPHTSKAMSEAELRDMVEFAFDSITTNGLNKRDPLKVNIGKGWSKAMSHERVIHYTPEGERYMRTKYGYGVDNYVNDSLAYIKDMAEKIAITETLGPNPLRTQTILKQLADKKLPREKAKSMNKMLDKYYTEFMGADPIVPGNDSFRAFEKMWRMGTMTYQLSGAMLASIADLGNVISTSVYTRTSLWNVSKGIFESMRASPRFHEENLRFLLAGEQYIDDVARTRYDTNVMDSGISGWLGKAADRMEGALNWSLEKTGLTPWTNRMRSNWLRHMLFETSDRAKLKWDELHQQDRLFYEQYGITQQQWDKSMSKAIKEIEFEGHKTTQLDLAALKELDEDLYRSLATYINDTGRLAVLTSSVKTEKALRDWTTGFGIFPDNVASAWFRMYRRFPLGQQIRYWDMMTNSNVSMGRRAAALATNFGFNLALATGVIQARQLLTGNDLKPMDNASFWVEAVLYAGAPGSMILDTLLGIGGITSPTDLERWDIFSSFKKLPPVRSVMDPYKEVANASKRAFEEQSLDPILGLGVQTVRGAAKMVGADAWMWKPFTQRMFDELQEFVDPDGYDLKKSRREDYLDREGQGTWWNPNEMLPHRAPRFDTEHPEGGLGDFQKFVD